MNNIKIFVCDHNRGIIVVQYITADNKEKSLKITISNLSEADQQIIETAHVTLLFLLEKKFPGENHILANCVYNGSENNTYSENNIGQCSSTNDIDKFATNHADHKQNLDAFINIINTHINI